MAASIASLRLPSAYSPIPCETVCPAACAAFIVSACCDNIFCTSGVFETVPFRFVASRFRFATSCVCSPGFVMLIVPALTALFVVALWSPLSFWNTIGVTPPEPDTDDGPTALVLTPTDAPALKPALLAL
ncbi:large exoinvolved in heme utilization/adhesion domain protein [Burkholderia pseudomallei MSHR5596]|nr:large exoinvolved in heme utilization/adhesion domain protein [Burkholderia pseudomallei MSHR5596]